MTKRLSTAFEFAVELKDRVLKVSLSDDEIKSFAKAIDYSIGFFNKRKRFVLVNELIFQNVFLGSVVLREFNFTNNIQISYYILEEINNYYVDLLLRELFGKYGFNEYHDRLHIWCGLLNNINNSEQYDKDISILADKFYKFLCNKQCPKDIKRVLVVRFNSYDEYLIEVMKRMETSIKYIEKRRL